MFSFDLELSQIEPSIAIPGSAGNVVSIRGVIDERVIFLTSPPN